MLSVLLGLSEENNNYTLLRRQFKKKPCDVAGLTLRKGSYKSGHGYFFFTLNGQSLSRGPQFFLDLGFHHVSYRFPYQKLRVKGFSDYAKLTISVCLLVF